MRSWINRVLLVAHEMPWLLRLFDLMLLHIQGGARSGARLLPRSETYRMALRSRSLEEVSKRFRSNKFSHVGDRATPEWVCRHPTFRWLILCTYGKARGADTSSGRLHYVRSIDSSDIRWVLCVRGSRPPKRDGWRYKVCRHVHFRWLIDIFYALCACGELRSQLDICANDFELGVGIGRRPIPTPYISNA